LANPLLEKILERSEFDELVIESGIKYDCEVVGPFRSSGARDVSDEEL
jgi:hypothetical protein